MSRAGNKKLIVEFYGKPGAGKSTGAGRLSSEYTFTTVIDSFKQRHYILLSLRYPKTVYTWLTLLHRHRHDLPDKNVFRYVVAVFFSTLYKVQIAQKSKANRIVLDEGLVQRVLSFSDFLLSEEEIVALLRVSPLGEILIFVNDREPEGDRYGHDHPRAQLGEEYVTTWRNNLSENLNTLDGVLKQKYAKRRHALKEESLDAIIADTIQNV